ncbi:receptor-transporting protein 2 isoform X4 [Nycticebus coucang]|uniref:receptor-transporting protein 2 isoform X4 n=1 Tax=Nycticebus coucang TaxID=9470 RepID=UPI00234CAC2E|nr:receptor-transporting protein 2 isoform X4 [Nycticebus coucang]
MTDGSRAGSEDATGSQGPSRRRPSQGTHRVVNTLPPPSGTRTQAAAGRPTFSVNPSPPCRFHCSWCWHTWRSPHMVILFHMHLDRARRMGSVRMRVFKQLCYECGSARPDESSMLEENIESLVDNLITSLREQCYREDGGQYRIHVASRPDSGPHRPEFCEACQEGIVHWKPSQKLLAEEASTYASDACKPRAQGCWGYNFFSLRWCLFWAFLGLLAVYLQFSFRSSSFL